MYAESSTKGTYPQTEGNVVEVGTAMRYVLAGTIILSSSMLFHLSNYLHQDSSGPEIFLPVSLNSRLFKQEVFPCYLK